MSGPDCDKYNPSNDDVIEYHKAMNVPLWMAKALLIKYNGNWCESMNHPHFHAWAGKCKCEYCDKCNECRDLICEHNNFSFCWKCDRIIACETCYSKMTLNKDKWIKTSERLPEDGQRCWVCLEFGFVDDDFYKLNSSGKASKQWTDEDDALYYKFWQPYYTPEPPNNE